MTGTYEHSIDAKGRLFIPAKLREELGTTFYMTMGIDRSEMGAANGMKSFFTTLGTTIMGSVFGMMLGMFANFATALSAIFIFGAVCCVLVTPLFILGGKEAKQQ